MDRTEPMDLASALAQSGERALVVRAVAGDRDAFAMLVSGRIEPAFRTAMAILGQEADARDATQDAMLAAWNGIRGLRDPDLFAAWLHRILVNKCRRRLSDRRRIRIRELELWDDDTGWVPASTPPPDEPAADVDELDRAFERLKPDYRAVLVLRYYERRPVEEIARLLGSPEGTIKWRLHEARVALGDALREGRQ